MYYLNKYKIYCLLFTAYSLLFTAHCPVACGAVDAGLTGNSPAADVFLNVDELRPGMKGYGKTVFFGDRILVFDVEILGVLKNWETKNDMILVKLSGGPLEKTGVISGMSGSPVYVEDKVIGAVSYGWGFAKEAIAGVTPIKEMLKVLEAGEAGARRELGAAPDKDAPLGTWESPLEPQEIHQGQMKETLASTLGGPQPKADVTLKMVPIKTPLVVSGFDQRVLKEMSEGLEKYGLFPVQGGGGSAPGGADTAMGLPLAEGGQALNQDGSGQVLETGKMVPGAAIATILAIGDINASAVGTLTYRSGDNFLAFGHPFIQAGKTDIPMAGAHVHAVIPIQSTSLKLASPTRILGKIFQDSKSALAGTLGRFSTMIPCTIKVVG
ncbi:MAG: SpoIVB peptidase S55 domain-containing protein, partial [Candidatus Brocadiales bacterium]